MKFRYDVFLSYHSQDKAVVRPIAERLRADGVDVWFDEWATRAGDSLPLKIEEGLEHSRVMVLCMSANTFGQDWVHFESGTFRFRDPLNSERRFIPIRLDNTPIRPPLAKFEYIDWLPALRDRSYRKLIDGCRSPAERQTDEGRLAQKTIYVGGAHGACCYAFSANGRRLLVGTSVNTIELWDIAESKCIQWFIGHEQEIDVVT